MTSGFMIAAPRSGSGKTTVTLGLLRALARRGLKVGSFKCGPDYIDPAFHKVATGRSSYNLDSWTMSGDVLDANFARGIEGAEVVIAEGSMGLFDGVASIGATGDGSSSDIAARFGLPVVLVIDASGQSQSAGAVAMGFRDFYPDVKIAGVILGNVASERHRLLAARGCERAGIKVFGALPRASVPTIPERHLGLVQAGEINGVSEMIDALADAMEKHLDIDCILAALSLRGEAEAIQSLPNFSGLLRCARNDGVQKIALAQDVAFSFIYEHMIADWREQGMEILPFSPLADEAPDARADICWLAGGYPELYAEKLSGNKNFLRGLCDFAKQKPVHGECGGYMVLGEEIIDADGKEWKMSGLLPLTTSFAKRKLNLGYRAVRLALDCPIGKKNELVRGHEFHYATVLKQGEAQSIGEVADANGTALGSAGMKLGNVTGTFFHKVATDLK
jgi:cobyrinic acid a,c-diamide synthase